MNNTQQTQAKIPRLRFPEFQASGEWEKKQLMNLLSVGNGKDHKHLQNGDIPVYGSSGHAMRFVNAYLYDGESVCIGRKGTIDNPLFIKGKFWAIDTLFYTHSFKKCLPRFVYWLFQNIEWQNYNEASGMPSLSKTTIEKIEVLVPGIEEQEKIADCLSSLDELVAAHEAKLAALQAHKKGLMQQLFPRPGETTPRLRFPQFQHTGDWESKQLGDASVSHFVKTGILLDELNLDNYISTENLLPDFGGTTTASKLPPSGSFSAYQKGDILISNIRPYLKKIWLADRSGGASNDVIVIRPAVKVSNLFLAALLKNDAFITFVMEGAKGVKMPRGDISLMKQYPIALPSIGEQQRIGACFSSLDALIAAQADKIAALKEHKKGLLQQLFPQFN